MENVPRVGVGVIIIKESKILFQKRKEAHGDGCWSFPGGHLEYGEKIEDCAIREVREEIGIEIKNLKMGPITNDIFEKDKKHYITIFVLSEYASGVPRIIEKDKTSEISWFSWDDLPSLLFLPIENLKKSGFNIDEHVHKA